MKTPLSSSEWQPHEVLYLSYARPLAAWRPAEA
jgi:hypothetical protein